VNGTSPDARRGHLDALAIALIVGCCALWGLNQVVVKATMPFVPPLLQAAVRSTLAAALVFLYARRKGLVLVDAASARAGAGAGVLFGLEFCFVFFGLHYTTASRMVVFLYLAPFVVALGMPFISAAERPTTIQVAGLVAAFLALASAFHEGFASSVPTQWVGDAMAIAAGLFWGLTTLLVRATSLARATPERTLFYQLAVSAPVLWAASALAGEPLLPPAPGAAAVASLIFQAGLVAFASFLGWFWLLRHYPATRVSSFTFLTPVFGLLFGALLLDEPVTARLLLALGGVVVGIWLVNRR